MKSFDKVGSKLVGMSLLICMLFFSGVLFSQDKIATLEGKIFGVDGKPLEGAEVYLYNTSNVRRPGDFVSNKTGADGHYIVVVPSGQYWLVARWRIDGQVRLGPLSPRDRHSGEAKQVDFAANSKTTLDFTVANLMEMAMTATKKRPDLLRLDGRVLDQQGRPVAMSYVMASNKDSALEVPEFISAWTNAQGNFALYVPSGTYYVGAAKKFPPEKDCKLGRQVTLTSGNVTADVVLTCK